MFVQAGRAVLTQMPIAHDTKPAGPAEPFRFPEKPAPEPGAPLSPEDERAARRARREARAAAGPDPTADMSEEEARAARRARRQARLDAAKAKDAE